MKLETLLEQLFEEDGMDEAAVAVAQARSEQLALAIVKEDFEQKHLSYTDHHICWLI